MDRNRLKLNEGKTECLICPAKKITDKQSIKISLNGNDINLSSEARNLGVLFDDNLTLVKHVNLIIQSMYLQIKRLGHCRKFLSLNAAKTVAVTQILTRLDYCNSILCNSNESLLDRLQIAMNNVARVVLKRYRCDSATEMLKTLHWLPVKYCIYFKLSMLCFGYFDGSLPKYLADVLEIYTPARCLRSSCDTRIFVTHVMNLRTVGERSFKLNAPKIWNSIPKEIRYCDNKILFKRKLKTHYFQLAFPESV